MRARESVWGKPLDWNGSTAYKHKGHQEHEGKTYKLIEEQELQGLMTDTCCKIKAPPLVLMAVLDKSLRI